MTTNSAGDVHVVPTTGKPHDESPDCFCTPLLEYQDPRTMRRVYVHRSKEESH